MARGLAKVLADNTALNASPAWLKGFMSKLPPTPRGWCWRGGVWLMVGLAALMAAVLTCTRFGMPARVPGVHRGTLAIIRHRLEGVAVRPRKP